MGRAKGGAGREEDDKFLKAVVEEHRGRQGGGRGGPEKGIREA